MDSEPATSGRVHGAPLYNEFANFVSLNLNRQRGVVWSRPRGKFNLRPILPYSHGTVEGSVLSGNTVKIRAPFRYILLRNFDNWQQRE
jgi:hypothetical protein